MFIDVIHVPLQVRIIDVGRRQLAEPYLRGHKFKSSHVCRAESLHLPKVINIGITVWSFGVRYKMSSFLYICLYSVYGAGYIFCMITKDMFVSQMYPK